MDMSFSLRSRGREQQIAQADLLGSLLASIAARQASTPTALAQSLSDNATLAVACPVSTFAATIATGPGVPGTTAFNPGVAMTIVNARQQS